MKTRASMTNLSLTRRKKNSALLQMTTTVTILTKLAKVRFPAPSLRVLTNTSTDVPSRPTKKHDEESVTSSKRDDSPILKKASASLNLRSACDATFIQNPLSLLTVPNFQNNL